MQRGFHAATRSRLQIEQWWREWPDANIGLATGDGLVVVDLDSPEAELEAEGLGLPQTVEVRTARGRHLYYAGIGATRAAVRPGIDIRGEGGYVIAPPSLHASGAVYEWVRSLEKCALAPAPAWVIDAPGRRMSERPRERLVSGGGATFEEGGRNDGLFGHACAMRGIGMTPGEIEGALIIANVERCQPPLDDDEVTQIAASAGRHPVGRVVDKTLLALRLGPYETTVYLAIRASVDFKGVCFRSYESIAEQTAIGRSRVITAVKALEAAGLIDVKRAWQQCNVYTLLDPPGIPDKPKLDSTITKGDRNA